MSAIKPLVDFERYFYLNLAPIYFRKNMGAGFNTFLIIITGSFKDGVNRIDFKEKKFNSRYQKTDNESLMSKHNLLKTQDSGAKAVDALL